MLIGLWEAIDRPGKITISSHSGLQTIPRTERLVPRLQAIPGLKVELHRGPTPFCPGAFLLPTAINMISMAPRLFMPRGTCRLTLSHPQHPLSLPPVLFSTQCLEGARVMRLACQHHPSMCTPSQVVTMPECGYNFALPRSRCQELGEPRHWEQTLSSLWGQGLPVPPRVQGCQGLEPWVGSCSCTREPAAPALPT